MSFLASAPDPGGGGVPSSKQGHSLVYPSPGPGQDWVPLTRTRWGTLSQDRTPPPPGTGYVGIGYAAGRMHLAVSRRRTVLF